MGVAQAGVDAAPTGILAGAGAWPLNNFEAIIGWADGWLPVPTLGDTPEDVGTLRRAAVDAGRNPDDLAIIVDGVMPDPAQLDPWREIDIEHGTDGVQALGGHGDQRPFDVDLPPRVELGRVRHDAVDDDGQVVGVAPGVDGGTAQGADVVGRVPQNGTGNHRRPIRGWRRNCGARGWRRP